MNPTYIKSLIGLLLGFSIGFVCRFTNIPVPAPPMIYGAFLVLTITVGYMLVDYIISQKNIKNSEKPSDSQKEGARV